MPSDRVDPQKESSRTAHQESPVSVKDTKRQTDIVLFLEQELRTNPFGQNISGDHVYKRCERIAAAFHLLTSHIPSDEPLRGQAREECLQLFKLALGLRDELRAAGSENVKKMLSSIRKLISLARLLGIAGFVSSQNIQTLVEAVDEIGALVVSAQRTQLAEDLTLTRDELTPRRLESPIRDTIVQMPRRTPEKKRAHPIIKDTPIKDKDSNNGQKSALRAERIMDILRSGGVLGIKDIVSNLPEYSEKMIQRELAALTEVGKVRKIGAKRWSKYSVA